LGLTYAYLLKTTSRDKFDNEVRPSYRFPKNRGVTNDKRRHTTKPWFLTISINILIFQSTARKNVDEQIFSEPISSQHTNLLQLNKSPLKHYKYNVEVEHDENASPTLFRNFQVGNYTYGRAFVY